jgi:hypothetical protein
MALSSVSVVANALRLRRFRPERDDRPPELIGSSPEAHKAGRAGATAA